MVSNQKWVMMAVVRYTYIVFQISKLLLGHLYLYFFFLADDPFGCSTTDIPLVRSPRPNSQCIFPFKYNGTTEHKCLQSPAWCSTLVDDESGEHIGGWRRNRGYCEDNCNDKIGKKYFIMYIYF